MIGPARFHRDVNRRVAEIHPVVGPVIGGLDDIGAMIGKNSG